MREYGVWMWPETVRQFGAGRVLSACAEVGVTDVYFLVKGLMGTASYVSRFVPQACPGEDTLRAALDAAHGLGIRLHAWLTATGDRAYCASHPSCGLTHIQKGPSDRIADMTDPGYADYMRRAVEELARAYDVDGVHLDYIRYNHLTSGWSARDLARYRAQGADTAYLKQLMDATFYQGGGDGARIFDAFRTGDAQVRAMAQIRRENVAAFARALCTAARAARPRVTLSAALMPEGAYDDTAFADLHYGQNYRDAAALYDKALPMAYSSAYGKDSQWVADVARGAIARGLHTVAGLQAYEGGSTQALRADCRALRAVDGVAGICLFRAGACVLARQYGCTARVYNLTPSPITRMDIALAGGETRQIRQQLPPGGAAELTLPDGGALLGACAGAREVCVALHDPCDPLPA